MVIYKYTLDKKLFIEHILNKLSDTKSFKLSDDEIESFNHPEEFINYLDNKLNIYLSEHLKKIITSAFKKFGYVYIGSTINEEQRKKQHRLSGKNPKTKFARAIHDYGFDSFKYEILYKNDSISYDELLQIEENYIIEYDATTLGFNTLAKVILNNNDISRLGNRKTVQICRINLELNVIDKIFNSAKIASEIDNINYKTLIKHINKDLPYLMRCKNKKYIYIKLSKLEEMYNDIALGKFINIYELIQCIYNKTLEKYYIINVDKTVVSIFDNIYNMISFISSVIGTDFDVSELRKNIKTLTPINNKFYVVPESYVEESDLKVGDKINIDVIEPELKLDDVYLIYKDKILIDIIFGNIQSIVQKYVNIIDPTKKSDGYIYTMIARKKEINGYFIEKFNGTQIPIIGTKLT